MKRVTHGDGSPYGVRWDCPGCGEPHVVPTHGPTAWGFNDDLEHPTLSPSILVHPAGRWRDGVVVQSPRCHSFVRDGRIEFCSDSEHALAGKTVDLPEIPETPEEP